jgi:histidinol-phosphate aminotransferase
MPGSGGSDVPSGPAAAGPRLRDTIATIASYVPGLPLPATPGLTTYKISSNENPYPPLPGVLEAVSRAAAQANRYPDMFCTELVNALADHLGVPAAHVVPGTGSVGVLGQVVHAAAGPGDEVVFAWRAFESYPIVSRISGATPVPVPLGPGARHDLRAIAAVVTPRTRLVLICSPNNPTGPAVHADELADLIDALPADVLVVIDEAYREFVRDPRVPDALDLYRRHPNVAVLRTFSKAYGLAGLRVGYAVADQPVAEAVRKTSVPFGVSTVAQLAAIASLQARDELMARVELLVAERGAVLAALRDQGWDAPDSQANFVWLPLGERTLEFAAACATEGIAVRPFPGEGARCTVAEPEASARLLRVSARFVPKVTAPLPG